MATYVLTGYSPTDIDLVSGSSALTTGTEFRIDPDWDAQRDVRSFTITDDDTTFAGDGAINELGDDLTQTAVVKNADGDTLGSGRVYIEEARTLSDGSGNSVTLYKIEIGGKDYGWVSSSPLQPGNTYTVASESTVPSADAPTYASLAAASYDQDAANAITGTSDADVHSGGAGNDTISGGDGDDSIFGGAGADTIAGGGGADTIHAGHDQATSTGGTNAVGEAWTAIRLGHAADVDPTEFGTGSEDAASLIGTYGGLGAELYINTVSVSGADTDSDGIIDDNDAGKFAEAVTIDGYVTTIDSVQTYSATVTFTDGSTGSFTAVVFQTADGALYLAPPATTGADLSLLTSKPIQSISLNTVVSDNVELLDDRVDASYALPGDTDNSADTLDGGAGDDTIYFGAGDDTVRGGDGDDLIDDQAGTRLVGTNTLDGGSGDDTIFAGQGADTVYGGSGSDTLSGEEDNDLLEGGSGGDTISGGDGDDTIHGDFASGGLADPIGKFSYEYYELGGTSLASLADAGFDGATNANQPDGQGSVDTIDVDRIDAQHGGDLNTFAVKLSTVLTVTTGGTYTFNLSADDGAKLFIDGSEVIDHDGLHSYTSASGSLALGAGEHVVEIVYFENAGDEQLGVTISGPDTGNVAVALENAAVSQDFDDTIDGGSGADTIEGGAGDDTITGGTGHDTFVYGDGSGADTITDFDIGDDDSNGFTNDRLDVSGMQNPDGSPVTAWDVTTVDDGFGNAMLIFPNGETIVLQGIAPSQMQTASQLYSAGIPCFAAGTLIRTVDGPVPVEMLRPGDRVLTRDNGPRPVLWTAARRLGAQDLMRAPHLRPVLIREGALGNGQALTVSPQHGVLLRQGGDEVLVRATHLADLPGGGVRRMEGCRRVTYCHILFERHEVVFSNGIPSESYYPGPEALAGLETPARRELLALFPNLAGIAACRDATRPFGDPARRYSRRSRLPAHLKDFASAH